MLPPDRLYLTPKELGEELNARATVSFTTQNAPEQAGGQVDGLIGRAKAGRSFVLERADPNANLFDAGGAPRPRAAGGGQEGHRCSVEPGIGKPARWHPRGPWHTRREDRWLVA